MRNSLRKPNCGRAVANFAATLVFAVLVTVAAHAELLPVKTYTVADGMLRDNVYRIRQDSRGYFWFCSAEGVSRFDGYSFLNFTTSDGLADRHVNDVAETSSGRYLIATDAGITELRPKGLRNSADDPLFLNLPQSQIRTGTASVFLKNQKGQLLAGTANGLFRIVDDLEALRFEQIEITPGNGAGDKIEVTSLMETRNGDLYIGTISQGLFRIGADGSRTNFKKPQQLPSNHVTTVMEDRDGLIWVGTRPDKVDGGGLSLINAGAGPESPTETFSKGDGFPTNWITTVFESSTGEIWIGTTAGLCRWQGRESAKVCRLFTGRNGLCDMEVWSMAEDRDGNLWTGTRCGVSKKIRSGFTSFTTDDGLPIPMVNSLFEDAAGELYTSVNFPARLVSRFTENGFETILPKFPARQTDFGWGWMQSVLKDSAGEWWFPVKDGLYRFGTVNKFSDLASTTPEKLRIGEAGGEVFRTFEDSRRDVWIATTNPNGLYRFERRSQKWHDHSNEAGTGPTRVITAFAEDREGDLWITSGESDSALIRFRAGVFRIFGRSDGIPGGWTKDVHIDKSGRIWLATANDGLLRVDNPQDDRLSIQKYTTAEGLSSNGSYCITDDEFGRIYVGSGRGLDRIDPENGQVENFTNANGLPDSNVEIAYRDRRNALWFSTPKGLARLIPEKSRPRTAPTVVINAIRVNGIAKPVSIHGEQTIENMELNSDERQLEIEFVGLGPNPGEKLRYEYRLSGETWTKTNERTLGLVNLPAGDYRFEIRAVTTYPIYSDEPATLTFRIAAPLWQRWWFICCIFVIAALIVYWGYRSRVRKLLEIERTRTRIATDLHDDIGSNLSKISLLSDIVNLQFEQKNETLNPMLTSISEISRESVNSMNDIVWAINPQRDSMPELIRRMRSYAEGIFVEKGVRVIFEADAGTTDQIRLPMNLRRDLYLIFKESVNNAAKHSVCSRIEIELRAKGREIVLRIADNGRGFDISALSDGNGLSNIKSRTAANDGRIAIESSPQHGTSICVRFNAGGKAV